MPRRFGNYLRCAAVTRPMVPRSASLDADKAKRQLLEQWKKLATLQLPANSYITLRVHAVDLEDRLGDTSPIVVITGCLAAPNRGHLNSNHVLGAHVPVEEPSTASRESFATT